MARTRMWQALLAGLCCTAGSAAADTPVAPGELLYQHNAMALRPWHSDRLLGKVSVILHLAGRPGTQAINLSVINAIQSAKFPENNYQLVTIINLADAIPGSQYFVRRALENVKKETPTANVILDDDGQLKHNWQLIDGQSALLITDKTGKIQYVRDGKLNENDIHDVVKLIHTLLIAPAA
ncbi:YtfJ family protein [Enterobacterales bacterium CwR94]|nr:YtfJ family protein [Enterobacterales bacterium CwR94]